MSQEQKSSVEDEWGEDGREDGEVGEVDGPRSSWWLLSLPLIGGMLGWLIMMLVCYSLPKKFESVAVLQIHGSEPVLDPFGATPEPAAPDFVTWAETFQTEMQVITAMETLLWVVERLDLETRWNMSTDNCLVILAAITETKQIEGTDLVQIRVVHTSARDARDIAAKVPGAYKERRVSMEMARAQSALASLDGELRDQGDLVVGKRKVLDTIVQAIGIPYVEGEELDMGRLASRGHPADAERILGELELEQAKLQADLKVVLGMTEAEIAKNAQVLESIPDQVQKLRREYLVEQRVLEEMSKAGMEGGDLEWIRQRALVAVLDEELRAVVTGLRERLALRLQVLETRVEAARSAVSEQRDEAVAGALESHDYVEAKREYETSQAMLQMMKKQYSSKRIALKIPRNPITIHEHPKEGKVPVSPDVGLFLATGKFGGAGLGGALALLIAGVRRGRERTIDDGCGWADD